MKSKFILGAASLALVGTALFVLNLFVAASRFPGYSQLRDTVSEAAAAGSPHPWVQKSAFFAFGVCVVLFAVALMVERGRVFAGAVLFGVLGVNGLVMEGTFDCDAGCKGKTTEGMVHLLFGLSGFVCGVIALFLLARAYRRDSAWADHARFTRIAAWCALGGLIAFMASDATPSIAGLIQRLFVGVFFVWIVVTSAKLIARTRTRGVTPARPSPYRDPSAAAFPSGSR